MNQTAQWSGWQHEPDGRGTWGILKACVFTLVLCVYTAVHLNVPPKSSTYFQKNWDKVQWVLIGMFAPELIIFVAWCQKSTANQLRRRLKAIFLEQEARGMPKRKHSWTLDHSFFAIMGGFTFDPAETKGREYIPGSPQLVFTPEGIEFVARLGYLPDLPLDTIRDKSKADSVAKTLVIIQAGWLVVQCLSRKAFHLPISLLELNTLAHALAACVVYYLWWNKPLDVRDPVSLVGDWVRPLSAMMYMASTISNKHEAKQRASLTGTSEWARVLFLQTIPKFVDNPPYEEVRWQEPTENDLNLFEAYLTDNFTTSMDTNSNNDGNADSRPLNEEPTELQVLNIFDERVLVKTLDSQYGNASFCGPSTSLSTHEVALPVGIGYDFERETFRLGADLETNEPVDATTLTRWTLFRRCIYNLRDQGSFAWGGPMPWYTLDEIARDRRGLRQKVKYVDIYDPNTAKYTSTIIDARPPGTGSLEGLLFKFEAVQDLLCLKASNWFLGSGWRQPTDTKILNDDDLELVNDVGWEAHVGVEEENGYYPKVGALLIFTSCTLLYGIIHIFGWHAAFSTEQERLLWKISAVYIALMGIPAALLYTLARAVSDPDDSASKMVLTNPVLGIFSVCAMAMYAFCRLYLVIESFVGLRWMPASVYDTPEWLQYLPHF